MGFDEKYLPATRLGRGQIWAWLFLVLKKPQADEEIRPVGRGNILSTAPKLHYNGPKPYSVLKWPQTPLKMARYYLKWSGRCQR